MDARQLEDLLTVSAVLAGVAGLVALRARGRRALWLRTSPVTVSLVVFVLVRLRTTGRPMVPLHDDGLTGTSLDLRAAAVLLLLAVLAVDALAMARVPRVVQWMLVVLAVIALVHVVVVRWIA